MFFVDCNKLRALSLARGCSIKTLADSAGLNPATVTKMIEGEGNNKPIRIQTLGKIAKALGVNDAFNLTVGIPKRS